MEIEIKLCVLAERLPALKSAVARGKSSQLRLVAHYFDAADGRLAQARAALRVRLEGERWVQTAKAIAQGPMVRLEHNVDLGPANGDAVPDPDWRRHLGSPVGEVLAGLLEGQVLQPIHGTDIVRTLRRVRSGSSLLELALDEGCIAATDSEGRRRELPVAELEIELVRGQVSDLHAMAARWMARHGLWLDTRSKAERGEALRAGLGHWAPVAIPVWRPEQEARFSPLVMRHAVLRSCLSHALLNLDALASGHFLSHHVRHAHASLVLLHWAWRTLAPLAPGMGGPEHGAALASAINALESCQAVWHDCDEVRRPLDVALRERGLTVPEPQATAPLPELIQAKVLTAARQRDLQQAMLFWMVCAAQPPGMEAGGEAVAHPQVAAGAAAPAFGDMADAAISSKAARQHLMSEVVRLHRRIRQAGKVWGHLTPAQRDRLRQRCGRLTQLLSWVWPLAGSGTQSRLLGYWQHVMRLHTALQALADATRAAQRAESQRGTDAVMFERGYWLAQIHWLGTLCERHVRRLKPFWD